MLKLNFLILLFLINFSACPSYAWDKLKCLKKCTAQACQNVSQGKECIENCPAFSVKNCRKTIDLQEKEIVLQLDIMFDAQLPEDMNLEKKPNIIVKVLPFQHEQSINPGYRARLEFRKKDVVHPSSDYRKINILIWPHSKDSEPIKCLTNFDITEKYKYQVYIKPTYQHVPGNNHGKNGFRNFSYSYFKSFHCEIF